MPERLAALLRSGRWRDPALGVGLAAMCLFEYLVILGAASDPDPPLVALVVLCGCTAVAASRRHPLASALTLAPLFIAQGAIGDLGSDPNTFLLVVWVLAYSAALRSQRLSSLGVVAALTVSLEVGGALVGESWVPPLFTFAPWVAGRLVRSRGELVAALTERTLELEAEQDAFARLAVRRERARIARDLHDIVAHHIAVIVVQAGAGRIVADGHPDVAAQRFSNIRESGEHALEELVQLVDVLHPHNEILSEAPLDRLNVLLRQARAAGLRVDMGTPLASGELTRELEETAYRAVQEGLTNAFKHAPGAEVIVRLATRDGALEVEVHDDGGGGGGALQPNPTGSGLGLVGMRERVAAGGGQLDAGPENGGWCLRVRLPVHTPKAATPPRRS
jgi:signal transduction histidine kinase